MVRFRFLLTLYLLLSAFTHADSKVAIGDTPPNYIGRGVDGKKAYLEDYKGKVVIVSFWASWCGPCLREIPVLDKIQRQLGPDHIKIIAVNKQESKKKFNGIKKVFEQLDVMLTHDLSGTVSGKYGVSSIPHLFIIDQEGKLAYHKKGFGKASLKKIVAELNDLLVVSE